MSLGYFWRRGPPPFPWAPLPALSRRRRQPIVQTTRSRRRLQAGEGRRSPKLADELVTSFVFRDKAEDYAAMLRKNAAAGRYDTGTRGDVAKLMTEDLLAVHKDGHLACSSLTDAERTGSGDDGPPNGLPPLIQSAKTIAPGVAYIRFTAFWGNADEVAAACASGSPRIATPRRSSSTCATITAAAWTSRTSIFSYLYSPEHTPLVKMALAKHLYDAERIAARNLARRSRLPRRATRWSRRTAPFLARRRRCATRRFWCSCRTAALPPPSISRSR